MQNKQSQRQTWIGTSFLSLTLFILHLCLCLCNFSLCYSCLCLWHCLCHCLCLCKQKQNFLLELGYSTRTHKNVTCCMFIIYQNIEMHKWIPVSILHMHKNIDFYSFGTNTASVSRSWEIKVCTKKCTVLRNSKS